MRLILLSGGSGKRLWPVSNDARAKQFLRVLKNDEGQYESMVQRVWRQLAQVGVASKTVIAASKSQQDILFNQLGRDVPLVIEPERRDTFPAIALAAAYLYTELKVSESEVIGVLAVDPHVEEPFFNRVLDLEHVLSVSETNLALIGVEPTYPSAKYGYIVPKENHNDYMNVSHFVEKPSDLEAQALIELDALWNCGVFAFKLEFILDIIRSKGLPITYSKLVKQYHLLPKISFDYEVVEKVSEIAAIEYKGSWKDLGTWNTLTEEMDDKIIGNGVVSHDSSNTHIINELDIPVKVLGVSDAVVAASPDGVLVTAKKESSRLKEVLGDEESRPMYEERRWGWYRVLDYSKLSNGQQVLTKRLCITEGNNLSYQLHHFRSEVWTVVSGSGEFILNDKLFTVQPGDVLQIPIGAKHAIRAITDIEIIEVQMGTELVEEDIIRLAMSWEEISQSILQ